MRRISLSALVTLACGVSLAAAPTPELVHGAVGPQYVPYSDPALPGGGLANELVQRAFALQNTRVDYAWLPWRRVENETAQGRYQLAWPFVRTPDRERQFLYSDPVYTVSTWVFARPQDPILTAAKADFSGRTLCRPEGYATSGEVEQALQAVICQCKMESQLAWHLLILLLLLKCN